MTPAEADRRAIEQHLDQQVGHILAVLGFEPGKPVPHTTAFAEIEKVMAARGADDRYLPLAKAIFAPARPWMDAVTARAEALASVAPARWPANLTEPLAKLNVALVNGNPMDVVRTVSELPALTVSRLPPLTAQAYTNLRQLGEQPAISAWRLMLEYAHGEREHPLRRSYFPKGGGRRLSVVPDQEVSPTPRPLAAPSTPRDRRRTQSSASRTPDNKPRRGR
ncbi:hypothetical protein [Cryptosporangium aurantiacum]|uniref:Uncharacterized protein n=1 Tax=Cryptosporangium aurantiacum TaxID=134849 RepID=A0A1M7PPZ8_9ACTN|nr:hypothetical protein [Cryptosporangium aurantiacum]SHN19419.1 hypothetical protein SAMN05443668_103572 [Cryptosporangium aurantiacum]